MSFPIYFHQFHAEPRPTVPYWSLLFPNVPFERNNPSPTLDVCGLSNYQKNCSVQSIRQCLDRMHFQRVLEPIISWIYITTTLVRAILANTVLTVTARWLYAEQRESNLLRRILDVSHNDAALGRPPILPNGSRNHVMLLYSEGNWFPVGNPTTGRRSKSQDCELHAFGILPQAARETW